MAHEKCRFGICYQHLHSGDYKYELTRDYPGQDTGITGREGGNPFVHIAADGKLDIQTGYAWDGPSGPAIDTDSFMRGSLVHDALYQLMRERVLDHRADRKAADVLLRRLCREDGMWPIRAWYVYRSVRWFGGSSAKPAD